MPGVMYAVCLFVVINKPFMLSVIMLNVIMPNVIMLNAITPNVIMLSFVMLCAMYAEYHK
jgi:hypothetical protein